MTHTTNDATVTVEQRDREAAASCVSPRKAKAAILSGDYDDSSTVQAFARHRLAALASAPAGDGVEAFEAAAIEAERIGTRWAEDTDHPATSRAVGKAIATSIRALAQRPIGEADDEVARIMAMSDDEIVRTATGDDAAWARGFKLGMSSGGAAASTGVVEEMARAIFEADPDVGMTWAAFLALADREPDFLQNVEHTRRAARAAALARPRAAVETVEFVREWLMSGDHPVSDWERQFAAAIDARPRAVVGERPAVAAALCDDVNARMIAEQMDAPSFEESSAVVQSYWIAIAGAAILALQSPPAKVEG